MVGRRHVAAIRVCRWCGEAILAGAGHRGRAWHRRCWEHPLRHKSSAYYGFHPEAVRPDPAESEAARQAMAAVARAERVAPRPPRPADRAWAAQMAARLAVGLPAYRAPARARAHAYAEVRASVYLPPPGFLAMQFLGRVIR